VTDLAWTSKESIAIDLIFASLGENRFNRTAQAYLEIESRLPKLEAAFAYVNAKLAEVARYGQAPYQISYFKKGDQGHFYVPFPTSLSRETVRKAIKKYRDQAAMLKRSISY
jgi:hypothetical protein